MKQYVPRIRSDIFPHHSGGKTKGQKPQDLQVSFKEPNNNKGKVNQSQSGNGSGKGKAKGREDKKTSPQYKCKLEAPKDGEVQTKNMNKKNYH